jgi:hypothetical protein
MDEIFGTSTVSVQYRRCNTGPVRSIRYVPYRNVTRYNWRYTSSAQIPTLYAVAGTGSGGGTYPTYVVPDGGPARCMLGGGGRGRGITYNLPFLFPVHYCLLHVSSDCISSYLIGKLCCLLFPEDCDDAFSVCLLLIGVSALELLWEKISFVYLSSSFFSSFSGLTSFAPYAHQNSPSFLLSSLQV